MEQTRWRILAEHYAIHAREFSDAVARLGRVDLSPRECCELLEEIRLHHESCGAAAKEMEQYMEQHAAAAGETRYAHGWGKMNALHKTA